MTEVLLHVYDVANSDSVKTNNAIIQLNKVFKDGVGLGGIFHSAVEILEGPFQPYSIRLHLFLTKLVHLCHILVYGNEEWSFGFCEHGSGVFSCPSKQNPMYLYRESLSLGSTQLSPSKVNEVLRELQRKWRGNSYDLLSRNCNHFCNEFCERLGVQKLPGWVNRFANVGVTAVEVAETTAKRLRQAKTEVVSASKAAYHALFGGPSTSSPSSNSDTSDSGGNGGGILRLPFLKTPMALFSRTNSNNARTESPSMNGSVQSRKPGSGEESSSHSA